MKKTLVILICFLMSLTLLAKLRVVTAYPYMKDIVHRIGKDKIKVIALSPGNWDPHVIVPKPSLIAQVRKADCLIINGAQLEIGWIPPVIRQANNAKVMPGKKGFLDLSNFVKMIQVPDSVSRAQGDIHPAGNPHSGGTHGRYTISWNVTENDVMPNTKTISVNVAYADRGTPKNVSLTYYKSNI